MSEASLPFNEKYEPSGVNISSGDKRKAMWEQSIQNRDAFWTEKAQAIGLNQQQKCLMTLTRPFTSGSPTRNST